MSYQIAASDRADHLENIRARLSSYRCNTCEAWITAKEHRPDTFSVGLEMCSCPYGSHNSLVPDVNHEDVEWLVSEIDRLRTPAPQGPNIVPCWDCEDSALRDGCMTCDGTGKLSAP